MPYNRDEVVASVTDFYQFLTTYLHFQPSELKTPPPSGWLQINTSRFAFLGKSDKVINLLQHLPYLSCSHGKKWIYDRTVCTDYMDEAVDKHVELGDRNFSEPFDWDVENCPWDRLRERMEHIAVIGQPEVSDGGHFIFLDTLDGEVAVWNVEDRDYVGYDSAQEFFTSLRNSFEELERFPTPYHVEPLNQASDESFKKLVRSFGWPPQAGGGEWRREECLKEIERLWPDYI